MHYVVQKRAAYRAQETHELCLNGQQRPTVSTAEMYCRDAGFCVVKKSANQSYLDTRANNSKLVIF